MLAKYLIAENSLICNTGTTIKEAANLLVCSDSARIAVLENNKVKGILTAHSLSKAYLDNVPLEATIDNYLEKPTIINFQEVTPDFLLFPLEKTIIVDDKDTFLGFISSNKLTASLRHQRDNASGNLEAILSASSNCILCINTDCLITYLNESAARLLGVSVEEALGQHINKLIPNSRLPEVLKTGQPEIGWTLELKGKSFITNRTPVIQNGNIIGTLAIFQDITELQSIIDELTKVREYKETLETIIDNDYDCIVVVDTEGIITMYNKAYEDFIGIPKEQAIGRHVTEVIENTRLHIVVKSGIPEMAALQKICGREMICNRVPIKENGKIIGAIGKTMFRDFKDFTAFVDKFSKMQVELEYYRDIVKKIQGSHYTFDHVIGSGPEITEVKEMAQRAAQRNSTVLIRGESGTGKELFSHSIHFASMRKNGPFIKINCSAIPESLLESELFGYEEGAFTGAKKGGKPGKFELAHKGTLFLDEIGDMAINMQSKLLRVLQEKEIERVGGTAPIPVDVRVIAATNRNLEELIKQEKFRLDLYYRLNVVELRIPPLRYHKKDMDELTCYLLAKLSGKLGCPIPVIDEEARQAILSYNWPGNIRELENVLERCLNFIDNGVIKITNLPYHVKNAAQGKERKTMELRDHIEEAERLTIINALKTSNGNKVRAAKLLGISRANIYQKITKYNI
jgi:PAS domain S-box-containing protein